MSKLNDFVMLSDSSLIASTTVKNFSSSKQSGGAGIPNSRFSIRTGMLREQQFRKSGEIKRLVSR